MVRARTALPLCSSCRPRVLRLLGAGSAPRSCCGVRRPPSRSVSSRRSTAGSPASARASATRSDSRCSRRTRRSPIKGWTIKVRVLDDSSDPDKGVAAATKLAADPTVVAVVGPYNSGVAAEPCFPCSRSAGIALVSPSNTLTSLTLGDDPAQPTRPFPDYFRLVGPDSLPGRSSSPCKHARVGFSNAAIVSETKAVSQGLADAFADAFADGRRNRDRAADRARRRHAPSTTFSPPSRPHHPVSSSSAASTRSRRPSARRRPKPASPCRSWAATASTIPTSSPAQDRRRRARTRVASAYPSLTLPGAAKFRAAYEAAGYTAEPTDYGPYAYDATNLVIAALRKPLAGKQKLPIGHPQAGRARRAGHRHRRASPGRSPSTGTATPATCASPSTAWRERPSPGRQDSP